MVLVVGPVLPVVLAAVLVVVQVPVGTGVLPVVLVVVRVPVLPVVVVPVVDLVRVALANARVVVLAVLARVLGNVLEVALVSEERLHGIFERYRRQSARRRGVYYYGRR